MAFTAQDVITEVRDQHPALDPERTPDTVLVRQIARYTRELYQRAVERDSTVFVDTTTIDLPLATFEDGTTLPSYVQLTGADIILDPSGAHEPLHLVPFRNRFTPGSYSAAYLLAGKLYLCGNESDWSGVDSIQLAYVPEPTLPVLLTDPVPLPDAAKRVLVDNAAWWTARRSPTYEGAPMDVGGFYTIWKESEREFLIEIGHHSRAESVYVREEW